MGWASLRLADNEPAVSRGEQRIIEPNIAHMSRYETEKSSDLLEGLSNPEENRAAMGSRPRERKPKRKAWEQFGVNCGPVKVQGEVH